MTWDLLQMGLVAWLLFAGLISLAIALLYPWARAPLAGLAPELRVVVLRTLLVGPALVGLLAAALCYLPKTLGRLVGGPDHCHHHGDAHLHFCPNHPPELGGVDGLGWALGAVALAVAVAVVVRARPLWRSRRALGRLTRMAWYDTRLGAWVVPTELPLALAAGSFRRRVFLSTGLLLRTPTHLVDVVLAHERAHEARRDSLWGGLTALASIGHLPSTARRLCRDLALASEQACDELAARATGDRARVAEALVAVARQRRAASSLAPAALAFGEGGLSARVESLLSPRPARRGGRGLMVLLALGCAALAVAVADPLHHCTETFLHHLLT